MLFYLSVIANRVLVHTSINPRIVWVCELACMGRCCHICVLTAEIIACQPTHNETEKMKLYLESQPSIIINI